VLVCVLDFLDECDVGPLLRRLFTDCSTVLRRAFEREKKGLADPLTASADLSIFPLPGNSPGLG
jgi:hypothetical protein